MHIVKFEMCAQLNYHFETPPFPQKYILKQIFGNDSKIYW